MNPHKKSTCGHNKTGMQTSLVMAQEMLEESRKGQGSIQYPPHVRELRALDDMEREYIQRAGPIGTVPLPGTLKSLVQTGARPIEEENVAIYIDKLGERLSFERTGVRLYDAFLRKCQSVYPHEVSTPIPLDRFIQFRNEEWEHFRMLHECMESLGADPSGQTPFADTNAVMSMGTMQVLCDPRTSLPQCTQAVVLMELSDHDGWELLIKLAEEMGQSQMGERFWQALQQEKLHLKELKNFHEHLTLSGLKTFRSPG